MVLSATSGETRHDQATAAEMIRRWLRMGLFWLVRAPFWLPLAAAALSAFLAVRPGLAEPVGGAWSEAAAQTPPSGFEAAAAAPARALAQEPVEGVFQDFRDRAFIRLETGFGATTKGDVRRSPVVRLQLTPGEQVVTYAGGGVGRESDVGGYDPDGALAGRLIGGVAAPLGGELHLFGEFQHVRRFGGRDGVNRALFGLRRGF